MGTRPARRAILGLAVLVAVPVALLQGTGSASTAEHVEVVHGVVQADGSAAPAPGWHVEHPSPGYYVLAAPAPDAELDVDSWDGDPELAINPLGDGTVVVTFTEGSRGVDTRFAWRAVLHR